MAEEMEVQVMSGSGLQHLTRGEVDGQVATAHQFPRSIATFKTKTLEMAMIDIETADSCFYAIPRAGKIIPGASIRLAEIAASCFGNMRVAARVIEIGEKFVTAQGVAHDLEQNVQCSTEIMVRITNKKGVRYNEDGIMNAANSACSKAMRNAIFRVVPKALINDIYKKCMKAAAGDITTLASRRGEAVQWFTTFGITAAQLFKMLGVNGMEDVTSEHIMIMKGIKTAVIDDEISIDDAMKENMPPEIDLEQTPPTPKTRKRRTKAEIAADKNRQEEAKAAEATAEDTPVDAPPLPEEDVDEAPSEEDSGEIKNLFGN